MSEAMRPGGSGPITPDEPAPKLTLVQWLICSTAAMGFAFDIFALLMLPLVIRPALLELGNIRPGTTDFSKWFGLLFYIPAFAGGIFGLLGGYLTDRLGRRRILVWSILLYAFSAFASGYATSLPMLLVLRCMTFVGVSVEFVAAVAWLAELFPHPRQREKVLGYTQAFSSIGGLMVALANGLAIAWVKNGTLPHIHIPAFLHPMAHHGMEPAWRYTLISGLIPAIPLIIIRPFLPESPAWQLKKQSGTMKRPSIAAIFSPELARTTIVTTIMFACSYGAAFGAIQQMPQIVSGLPQVQQKIKAAVAEATKKPATSPAGAATTAATMRGVPAAVPQGAKIPPGTAAPDPRARAASGLVVQETAASVTKVQEIGGLLGRVIFAILATIILSRRSLIRIFQIPGLIVMPLVFFIFAVKDLNLLYVGMFIAGLLTVAQFSFWGNYLPQVYPLHLRGTGESFAANIGGRMIGTSFAALTAFIAAKVTSEDATPVEAAHRWAFVAAGVGFVVYLVGFLMSFALPEPKPQRDEE